MEIGSAFDLIKQRDCRVGAVVWLYPRKVEAGKMNYKSANHGLIARDLHHIRAAAAELPEIDEVILFGSRAKGTHQQGSDVDLAIKGNGITHTTVLRLLDSLNEARPMPYFFDVLDYNGLANEPLCEHIDRVGIVLFSASTITQTSESVKSRINEE